jgi:hypothetical protein
MATEGLDSFIFKEIFMNYCRSRSGSPLLSSLLITAEGKQQVLKKNTDMLRTTELAQVFIEKFIFIPASDNSLGQVSHTDSARHRVTG